MSALAKASIRRQVVMSHPNHEAAIFGIVQGLRPNLVILTDGGGEPRPSQSRQALDRMGLLGHATFLDFRESDFYAALLDRDLGYFRSVIVRLRTEIEAFEPEQVICDAVEFYNPVHDLSLPIVRAALGERSGVPVFEAPLIYQKSGSPESYELQRFPISRRAGQIEFRLSDEALADKLRARDEIYESLRRQIGPLLAGLPAGYFASEVIGPAGGGLGEPGPDQTLRYDWRGKLLLERGMVKRAITRAEHYLPLATAILASAGDRLAAPHATPVSRTTQTTQ